MGHPCIFSIKMDLHATKRAAHGLLQNTTSKPSALISGAALEWTIVEISQLESIYREYEIPFFPP